MSFSPGGLPDLAVMGEVHDGRRRIERLLENRRPPEVDESPFLRERDSLAKRLPVAGVLVYGFHGRAARYSEASPGYGRGRYIPDRSGEHGVHDVAEGITPDCPNRCTRMHPETRMSRG